MLKKQQIKLTDLLNAVFLALVMKKYQNILRSITFTISIIVVNSCSNPVFMPAPVTHEGAPQTEVGKSTTKTRNLENRPGLATEQGRIIDSKVTEGIFFRESKNTPNAVDAIYYNDKEGLDRMVGRHKTKCAAMQSVKNGMITWSIKPSQGWMSYYKSENTKFSVGKKGKEYYIHLKNNTSGRVEVVLSVDGLDILTGKVASYKQRGYIIPPYQTLKVKGYRTAQNQVRAFKLSSVSSSYTNLLQGDVRNVGVIGLAAFKEKASKRSTKWAPSIDYERLKASPFSE